VGRDTANVLLIWRIRRKPGAPARPEKKGQTVFEKKSGLWLLNSQEQKHRRPPEKESRSGLETTAKPMRKGGSNGADPKSGKNEISQRIQRRVLIGRTCVRKTQGSANRGYTGGKACWSTSQFHPEINHKNRRPSRIGGGGLLERSNPGKQSARRRLMGARPTGECILPATEEIDGTSEDGVGNNAQKVNDS